MSADRKAEVGGARPDREAGADAPDCAPGTDAPATDAAASAPPTPSPPPPPTPPPPPPPPPTPTPAAPEASRAAPPRDPLAQPERGGAYADALGFVLLARDMERLRDEGRLDARHAKDARDRFLRMALRAAGEGADRDPAEAAERTRQAAGRVTALPPAVREALGLGARAGPPPLPAGRGPGGAAKRRARASTAPAPGADGAGGADGEVVFEVDPDGLRLERDRALDDLRDANGNAGAGGRAAHGDADRADATAVDAYADGDDEAALAAPGPAPTARSSLVLGFVVGGLAIVGGSIPLARLIWQSGNASLQYGAFVGTALLIYALGAVCLHPRVALPLAGSTFHAVFALLAPLVVSAARALGVGTALGFAGALALGPLAYAAMRHLLGDPGSSRGAGAGPEAPAGPAIADRVAGRAAGIGLALLAALHLAVGAPWLGDLADHLPAAATLLWLAAVVPEVAGRLGRRGPQEPRDLHEPRGSRGRPGPLSAGQLAIALLWPGAAAIGVSVRAVDVHGIAAGHLALPLLFAGGPLLALAVALAGRDRARGGARAAASAGPDVGAVVPLAGLAGGALLIASIAASLTAPWALLSTGLAALALALAAHVVAREHMGPAVAAALAALLAAVGWGTYPGVDAALGTWAFHAERLTLGALPLLALGAALRARAGTRLAWPAALVACALAAAGWLGSFAEAVDVAHRVDAVDPPLRALAGLVAVLLAGGLVCESAFLAWCGGALFAATVGLRANPYFYERHLPGDLALLVAAAAFVALGVAARGRLGRTGHGIAASWWVAGAGAWLFAHGPERVGPALPAWLATAALAALYLARALGAALDGRDAAAAARREGDSRASLRSGVGAWSAWGGGFAAVLLAACAAAEAGHAASGAPRFHDPAAALAHWAGGMPALALTAAALAAGLARRVAWLAPLRREVTTTVLALATLLVVRALVWIEPDLAGVREAAFALSAAAAAIAAASMVERRGAWLAVAVVTATAAALSVSRLDVGLDGLREAPHAGWLALAAIVWLALAEGAAGAMLRYVGEADDEPVWRPGLASFAETLRVLAIAPLAWATTLSVRPVLGAIASAGAVPEIADPPLFAAALVAALGVWLTLPALGVRKGACASGGACLASMLCGSAATLALAARLALVGGLDRAGALAVAALVSALATWALGRSAVAGRQSAAFLGALLHAIACAGATQWALATHAPPLAGATTALGALALAGLAAALFALAVRARLEEIAYGGLAALACLAVFLRVGRPDLFATGFVARHWPLLLATAAWALAGAAELCRRLGVGLLARPLVRAGVVLALVPAGGAFLVGSGTGAGSLFLAAGFFAVIAAREGRFLHAAVAVLFADLGLHPLLLAGGFRYGVHPELYFAPLGLGLVVAAHVAKHRLTRSERDAIGTIGTVIALASLLVAIYADREHRMAESVALALLSGLGAMLGTLVRVRAYVFASLAFLVVVIASHVYWAGQERPWVWWASLVAMGLGLVAFFALLERRRREAAASGERDHDADDPDDRDAPRSPDAPDASEPLVS